MKESAPILLAHPDRDIRTRWAGLIERGGSPVETVAGVQDCFAVGLRPNAPQVWLLPARWGARSGTDVAVELAARQIGPCAFRSVFLIGAEGGCAGLLPALEAGVCDWFGTTTRRELEKLNCYVRGMARVSGHNWEQWLAKVLYEADGRSGVFEITSTSAGIQGRIEVVEGSVARVSHVNENSGYWQFLENHCRKTPAAVAAWLRQMGELPVDWERALCQWGLTPRARLRRALRRQWGLRLQLLSAIDVEIRFVPGIAPWSPDLLFEGADLTTKQDPSWFVAKSPVNDVDWATVC